MEVVQQSVARFTILRQPRVCTGAEGWILPSKKESSAPGGPCTSTDMFKALRNSLNTIFVRVLLLALASCFLNGFVAGLDKIPRFRVVALAEHGGIHKPFVDAAKVWLGKLASENNFTVDYIEDTQKIDDAFLAQYNLFIQLNYPPYNWTDTAQAAFTKYIEEGKGGWIGFHHATLLGEFDGFPMWTWFHRFMGGVRFKNYIATFVTGTVTVEDKSHPAMKGIASPFVIENEEWYTYDTTPRPSVHVLASVDENSYTPFTDQKMGDHPVIWTNKHYQARNIYIFMGHHPELFDNQAFTLMFRNSIFWAAGQQENREK
jgi:type 1 glutamine amidotransferase